MEALLLYSLITVLKNTAIFFLVKEGNLLGSMRIWCANCFDSVFGKKLSRIIQKPLWDCLPCMASFWSFVWLFVDQPDIDFLIFIESIFVVCGMAVIIDCVALKFYENEPAD